MCEDRENDRRELIFNYQFSIYNQFSMTQFSIFKQFEN